MTDLGPGDMVEATHDMWALVGSPVTKVATAGRRSIVLRVITRVTKSPCGHCGEDRGIALTVLAVPAGPDRGWCPCGWRKIDGGEDDAKVAALSRVRVST
jgi:hypothetical protein